MIHKEHIGCTFADLAGVVQADKVNSGVNYPYGSSHAVWPLAAVLKHIGLNHIPMNSLNKVK